MDFSKFDKSVDINALKNDVQAAAEKGGSYSEIPHGNYEVKIDRMEIKESKKGDPMFSCWFRILNGEHKGSLIFMNQVITQGFQIHIVNEFLRSLDTDLDVHFDSFAQYNNLIFDIHEKINNKLEYALEYGERKGFSTYRITDVFELPF